MDNEIIERNGNTIQVGDYEDVEYELDTPWNTRLSNEFVPYIQFDGTWTDAEIWLIVDAIESRKFSKPNEGGTTIMDEDGDNFFMWFPIAKPDDKTIEEWEDIIFESFDGNWDSKDEKAVKDSYKMFYV